MITLAPRFTVTQDGTTLNVFHANAGEGLPAEDGTVFVNVFAEGKY